MRGTVLNTLTGPSCELCFIGKADGAGGPGVPTGPSLFLHSLEQAPKRILKNTILVAWREKVSVSSKVSEGVVWAVQPKDIVLVKESKSLMSMGRAMKEQYGSIGQIFGYDAFPAGSSPKAYVAASGHKAYRLDFSDESFNGLRSSIQDETSTPCAIGVDGPAGQGHEGGASGLRTGGRGQRPVGRG